MKTHRNKKLFERYDLSKSPFSQKPTQRDIATLLGMTRDDLRRLATHNYKKEFIVQRWAKIGKKDRWLSYPSGQLRVVHEKIKFHLNKVKQPDYLFSPRKKRSQRENASQHLDQTQFLSIDIKQFYPSTTFSHFRDWFKSLGMYDDVAGLLAHLLTIDGIASFGSPVTPVLCTLVHREMFNKISDLCDKRKLTCTLWVDDITISGKFVPGILLEEIREIISNYGMKSHKVEYRQKNRPVFITGIGVAGSELVARQSLHIKVRDLWVAYHSAETVDEKDDVAQQLLSKMGTLRYISGSSSSAGIRLSSEMNSLKQKRGKALQAHASTSNSSLHSVSTDDFDDELPWH